MGGKKRRKRKNKYVELEWFLILGVLLFALTKRIISDVKQLLIAIQATIQNFTVFEWIFFSLILIGIISIIYFFISYINQRKKQEKVTQTKQIFIENRARLLRNSEMQTLLTMDPTLFEEYVAELFMLKGYTAKDTPKTGDGGKDIILMKDGKITLA